MSTQTLGELLEKGLQYDSSWGIWAFGTATDAPARIGQTQFENGGILDGMSFIIDGERLGNAIAALSQGEPEDVWEHISQSMFLDLLIENNWIEYENPECYQTDPGCPECGGAMYGADFPNGDGHGVCCACGHEAEWDNEEAEWKEAE